MQRIEIHLRDLGQPLVDAWNRELLGNDSVDTSCGIADDEVALLR